jgi:probable F420-dependent oxidoreductase
MGYFPTHDGMGPGVVARLVEERGQDALFFAEHTHIPASRETPYGRGGELPVKYWHTYDLFVALTAAAAATTKLRVGSGICLVVERDPITAARDVASVDHLFGGRLEFGVGAGWNREEMRNHGTDPRTRMALLRERVEAMQAIWTQDEASYSGKFVNFDRIWSWSKPAQRPYPPVRVGGDGPTVLDPVLAFGDGWFPNYRPNSQRDHPAPVPPALQRLDQHLGLRHLPGQPTATKPTSCPAACAPAAPKKPSTAPAACFSTGADLLRVSIGWV